MIARQLARATTVAVALAVALVGIASADTAPGDADLLTPGPQASRSLGTVAPGATLTLDVGFVLTCRWPGHVDHGQVVTLTPASFTVPADGAAAAANGTLGPVPDTWPVDGEGCPTPNPTLDAATASHVTLTAPTVLGTHTFTIGYDRTLAPAGQGDDVALTGLTFVDLVVTVAPPVEPAPDPPPAVVPGPSAVFLPPLGGGELVVPRWVRSVPVKFRVEPTPSAAPALVLVPLAACDATAAAGPERAIPVQPAGKSDTWLGHAVLAGLTGPCVLLEVRLDGAAIGTARIALRQK